MTFAELCPSIRDNANTFTPELIAIRVAQALDRARHSEPPASTPVIGLDGKRYQPKPKAVAPPKPPRKSFGEVLNYRFLALSHDIDRLEQLIRSDRFRRNRTQIEGVEKIPQILHRSTVRLDAIAELARRLETA